MLFIGIRTRTGYQSNPLRVLDAGNFWTAGSYSFSKSEIALQARDAMQIGRRLDILRSGKFKIYLYPMSPEDSGEAHYKSVPMSKDTNRTLWDWCLSDYYGFEVLFVQFLRTNPFEVLTDDPAKASLFFVPVLSGCEFWRVSWPGQNNLTAQVAKAIEKLVEDFPIAREHFRANSTRRRDHLMSFSHDWGTVYAPEGLPERIITIGQISRGHGRRGSAFGTETIVVPPLSNHMAETGLDHISELVGFRPILAHFAGTCRPADPVRELFCAELRTLSRLKPSYFPVPPSILVPDQQWTSDDQIAYSMRRATFCLCPRGWSPTTTRFYDAVFHGCIPVLIGGLGNETEVNGFDFPFAEMLPGLRSAAILLPEGSIGDIAEVLLAISEAEVVRRQLSLRELRWAFSYRRGLDFGGGFKPHNFTRTWLDVPGEEGWDVFDYFLTELAGAADTLGLVG